MRAVLLVSLLVQAFNVSGQIDWEKRISIKVEGIALERFLEMLELKHGVRFSYGYDNIKNDIKISVDVKNESFHILIKQVCAQAGITFAVVDDVIVFKALPLKSSHRKESKIIVHYDSTRHYGNKIVEDFDPSVFRHPLPNSLSTVPTVHPIQLQQLPIRPVNQNVSGRNTHALGLYCSVAYDINQFRFKSLPASNQQYHVVHNQSFALGGYTQWISRFYVSLAAVWSRKGFGLDYNYLILDPNDPTIIPKRTVVNMNYLEIPLTIGVRIFAIRKNQIWLACGLNSSTLLYDNEVTSYQNSENQRTEHFTKSNNATIVSCSLGFIYHRSIRKGWGIFIEPDVHFFTPSLNYAAMSPPVVLVRAKTGLHYSFN